MLQSGDLSIFLSKKKKKKKEKKEKEEKDCKRHSCLILPAGLI